MILPNQLPEEKVEKNINEDLKKKLEKIINYSTDEAIKNLLTTYVNYSGEIIAEYPENIIYVDNSKKKFVEFTQISQTPLSKIEKADYHQFHFRKEQKTNEKNTALDVTIAKDGNSTRFIQILTDNQSHLSAQTEKHFINDKLVSTNYTEYSGDLIVSELSVVLDGLNTYLSFTKGYEYGCFKRDNFDYGMSYGDFDFNDPYANGIDCLIADYINNAPVFHQDFIPISAEEYDEQVKLIKNGKNELDSSIRR